MQPGRASVEHEVVLVGAGHAHVQILRRFMMKPVPGVRLTVVLDRPEAVYSGMVPGFVAGQYTAHDLTIDAVPLARRAGARVVLAPATRVDAGARRIELEGRPSLAYDVASLDVGSSVRGLELPGVREHALATRPIGGLVAGVEAAIARARAARGEAPLRIAVVGAGAAGVELAFCLGARLRRERVAHATSVFTAGDELLPGQPARVRARLARLFAAEGITLRTGFAATAVEKDALHGSVGGSAVVETVDLVVWAAGAAPSELLRESALPATEAGFLRVRETLQVVDQDALFAVGDCAWLDAHPWMPRAGVHAVREGPTLDHNLRALLAGRPLRKHEPQRDFLTLLNLGEGRAFGMKWGVAFAGRAVFRLKDAIDRRFMRRFQVLDEAGAPSAHFPSAEAMGMDAEEMACGGCAAKVGARPLEEALARLPAPPEDASVLLGLETPDDAALVAGPGGGATLTTIDGFRPFTDDPFLVGRVAAINAASDVLAKGGTPRHALALVTVPPDAEAETLAQVLAGVRAALDPLGASLVGGHTTAGEELFVALSILGAVEEDATLLPLAGGRPGDALILTRALGTGVILAADMQGRARGPWVAETHRQMVRPNPRARGAHAATDVSGFGLAVHLGELAEASGVGARVRLGALPLLPGAEALFAAGLRSTAHPQNVAAAKVRAEPPAADDPRLAALFDPQTSGGLLLATGPEQTEATLARLHAEGHRDACVIGELVPFVSSSGSGPRIDVQP